MKYRTFFWITILFLIPLLMFIPVAYGATKTITYDVATNVITAIGGDSGDPIDFEDLWNADKAGTYSLQDRDAVSKTDASGVATEELRPTDYGYLGGNLSNSLYIVVENWTNMTNATIYIDGKDHVGSTVNEYLFISGGGSYDFSEYYHELDYTQVLILNGVGSFDYEVIQDQWGVVWKQSDTQYAFDAKIVVGNGTVAGTTYFGDTNKQVTFNDGIVTANGQYLIEGTRYAHIQFGEIVDANTKSTSSGVSFISLESTRQFTRFVQSSGLSGSDCYLLSCSFSAKWRYHHVQTENSNDRIWHCQFMKNTQPFTADGDLYDIVVQDVYIGLYPVTASSERIWLGGDHTTCALYARFSPAVTVKNVEVAGKYAVLFYIVSKSTNPIYAINVDAPEWNFTWLGSSSMPLYRQYEFDLTTTANSTIEISYYGQGGGTIFNQTDADGTIPTQTISKEFYNQTGGDTPYSYEPIHLKISKSGYQTYEANFTLTEKTSWKIELQTSSPSVTYTSAILVAVGFLVVPLGVVIFVVWRRK